MYTLCFMIIIIIIKKKFLNMHLTEYIGQDIEYRI